MHMRQPDIAPCPDNEYLVRVGPSAAHLRSSMVLRMTDCQDVSKEPVRRRLSVAFLRNPRIEPLVDGSIAPAGPRLDWEFGAPSRPQARLRRDDDGAVFEYSLTQFMRFCDRAARPESGWTGLP